MLSLIICSVNPQQLADIRADLSDKIGVPYELLVWDNREANLGLCAVYNKMGAQAVHPYLVFLHEDVRFETQAWGKILLEIFQAPTSPAMVGIAGGKFKGRNYSGWFSGIRGADFYHIYHEDAGIKKSNSNKKEWPSPEVSVCCIDGVFMAVTKNVWQQNPFNEQLLKGFHFYDLDFSLRIAQKNLVVVTNRIDMVHLTKGGDYGERWVQQANIFHDAWKEKLPMMVDGPWPNGENRVAKTWLYRLKTEPVSFQSRLAWIRNQSLQNNRQLFPALLSFLGYRTLGFKRAFSLLKNIKSKVTGSR